MGNCHLTLPPEILPARLPAQPAWTPGPGSFHYGTAEGHSHPAEEKKETTVKSWSDVNPLDTSDTKSRTTESRERQHGQGKVSAETMQIQSCLAAWCLLSLSSPRLTVHQHTRWFSVIRLGWPVISWLWSRRWGMHLINPLHPRDF